MFSHFLFIHVFPFFCSLMTYFRSPASKVGMQNMWSKKQCHSHFPLGQFGSLKVKRRNIWALPLELPTPPEHGRSEAPVLIGILCFFQQSGDLVKFYLRKDSRFEKRQRWTWIPQMAGTSNTNIIAVIHFLLHFSAHSPPSSLCRPDFSTY